MVTLMFWASTLELASSSRLITVVLPANTAQCSAVFLWYLSPRFTDTLKVSRRRVGSTLRPPERRSEVNAVYAIRSALLYVHLYLYTIVSVLLSLYLYLI